MKIVHLSITVFALLFVLQSCASSSEASEVSSSTTPTADQQTNAFKNITASDFSNTVATENATVIDVRTPEETSQGVIEGCDMMINYNGDNFAEQIGKLDKSKAYVIYCRSGGRSSAASQYMVDQGFTKVYNLQGGINGWTGAVVKP